MLENSSPVQSNSKRKWYTLFSLLLWAQLIFSGGLTLWRYQLVLSQDWPIYPSNNSPQLDQFAAFIKTICSESEATGYISTEFNSFARLNYELYPRPFHNLSDLIEANRQETDDMQHIIVDKEIRCLVYDYAPDPLPIMGTRHEFSNRQFVLQLEPAE